MFTYEQAHALLRNARQNGRMPHALLFTGTADSGTHRLALALANELNGAQASTLETLRHPICRVLRPSSKIRSISIDAIRSIEPFLALRAAEGDTKLVIVDEADRLPDEAANAFLKTLEEPPLQTLIILITALPNRLLPTILSRCVRLSLRSPHPGVQLTPVQQAFLPAVRSALPRLGSDMAALALRADFQQLLARQKEEIASRLTSALKAEAKSVSEGTDIRNWESLQKDATNAQIESEYLGVRTQMLELLTLCLGQAVLLASHAPDAKPLAPEVQQLSQHPVADLLRRMRAVDDLRRDLSFNVNEPLALDSRLLDIIGASPY